MKLTKEQNITFTKGLSVGLIISSTLGNLWHYLFDKPYYFWGETAIFGIGAIMLFLAWSKEDKKDE